MGSELEPRRQNLPAPLRIATSSLTAVAGGAIVFVLLTVLAGATAGVVGGLLTAAVLYPAGAWVRKQIPASHAPARKLSAADEVRAMHGDVRKLAPGDVVYYELIDWVVDRTMRFTQDGFTWQEHMLIDSTSGRTLWLSVEDDDGLQVAVYERVRGAEYDPEQRQITHDGVTYTRDERGTARFVTSDESGTVDSGQMQFADYSNGDKVLGLERYATTGSHEVSVGTVISEHELDIYPKSR